MSKFNIDGVRSVSLKIPKTDIPALTEHWKQFITTIPSYSKDFEGKGIVICAGGACYFTCCWVLINILRKELKCNLPIQVWYSGNEMNQTHIQALLQLNVICHNFLDYDTGVDIKGYLMKPMSMILSSFKEVLYLDADNVCTINPALLFDLPEYKENGAVFWPDFWVTDKENPIWDIIQHAADNSREQESGQILINKQECWKELNLALYFNLNKHLYYHLLHGDKDTFRFAWLALRKNVYFIQHPVASAGYIDENKTFIGHTMLQHLPNGQVAFLHRNLVKWDKSDPNKYIWQKVKKFSSNSLNKQYFTYWYNKENHAVMDLQGDVEISDFPSEFRDIEKKCLTYLKELRNSFSCE